MSYEILLASRSPRRASLMDELGIPYRVVDTEHTDEVYPLGLKGGEIARYLAVHKSDAYTAALKVKQVLLTADTIVWQDGVELGKPLSREDALAMINVLSGRTHQVFTGVCLRSAIKRTSFYVATDVSFSHLDAEEISYYVDHYKPFDKAGAYGIQEWIGHIAVERINGSYFNVMGLPVQKVYSELKTFIKSE
ncbi:MAG: septum formation protein Maf [Bacteroidetes bacterium]|nr:septum formation protein Maf [Bacteroidota bacterium]